MTLSEFEVSKLRKANIDSMRANRKVRRILTDLFPVGSAITFLRRGEVKTGECICILDSLAIKVRRRHHSTSDVINISEILAASQSKDL